MLPLIIVNGRFKHLCMLDDNELERFLRYLIRFTCKSFGLDENQIPHWWTETVLYHPDYVLGSVSVPETRNKHVKLRRLIKLCYLHYNCKSLLIMSDQLATLHPQSYKFMQEPSGNIAVYRVKTMTVLVRIPASNLDYNVDRISPPENGHKGSQISRPTSNPVRRPVSLLSPKKTATAQAECIVIDSSSESDDEEVQIISYEPGALPPTPPKIRPPMVYRPGPACSKIRPAHPFNRAASVQQRLDFGGPPRPNFAYRRPPPRPGFHHYRRPPPRPGFQHYRQPPPQPPVPARSKYLLCRPRRNITIEKVDLTVDDDEEEYIVQPTEPKDLTQGDFLARMGLGSTSDLAANPKKTVFPPPVIHKKKRLNVRDIDCTMIPYLVSTGYLPRKALCTPSEVVRRTAFIDKYTSKDTNWFLVTVNYHDKAAVASVVRKCSIPLKRLNSADLRRWRRRLTPNLDEL